MKYLLTLLFGVLTIYSCTQVTNESRPDIPYEKFKYNVQSNGTIYDSAWVRLGDTLVFIEREFSITDSLTGTRDTTVVDTFHIRSRSELEYDYACGCDKPQVTWDTVVQVYTTGGLTYLDVVGGDTLSSSESEPSSEDNTSSAESTNSSNSATSTESSTSLSSGEIVSSTDLSSSIESSAALSSSAIEVKDIEIDVLSGQLLDSALSDSTNLKLYLMIYYTLDDDSIEIDIDNLILRYTDDDSEALSKINFDSLSFSEGAELNYNAATLSKEMRPNDTVWVQLYYAIDTTKTINRISFSNYDAYFYTLIDTTLIQ